LLNDACVHGRILVDRAQCITRVGLTRR
jgi:hypothetical protein